jgi:hypothetical protein
MHVLCRHHQALKRITGFDRSAPSEDDDKGLRSLTPVELFWTAERRSLMPIIGTTLPWILGRPAGNIAAESLFSHASLVLSKRRGKLEGGLLSTLVTLHYDGYSVVNHLVPRECT